MPLRWFTDDARKLVDGMISRIEGPLNTRDLSIEDISIVQDVPVQCPPFSITNGPPKSQREKVGKETTKQVRACSFCKRSGHNITKCPEKENYNPNQVPSDIAKKRKKGAHDGGV